MDHLRQAHTPVKSAIYQSMHHPWHLPYLLMLNCIQISMLCTTSCMEWGIKSSISHWQMRGLKWLCMPKCMSAKYSATNFRKHFIWLLVSSRCADSHINQIFMLDFLFNCRLGTISACSKRKNRLPCITGTLFQHIYIYMWRTCTPQACHLRWRQGIQRHCSFRRFSAAFPPRLAATRPRAHDFRRCRHLFIRSLWCLCHEHNSYRHLWFCQLELHGTDSRISAFNSWSRKFPLVPARPNWHWESFYTLHVCQIKQGCYHRLYPSHSRHELLDILR